MFQYLLYRFGRFNTGDNLHFATTLITRRDIYVEHPFQSLGPVHTISF